MSTRRKFTLHAPNNHTGGGYILLSTLLDELEVPIWHILVDQRAAVDTSKAATVTRVKPSVFSRLKAEWTLCKTSHSDDIVLSLNGLPPLLPNRAKVYVFLQNRLLIDEHSLNAYPFKTRLRLWCERLWLKCFKRNATSFIVQTPSMARTLKHRMGEQINILVKAYTPSMAITNDTTPPQKQYDFIYVADALAHKNHLHLLEAWKILASEGLYPSLALTLDERTSIAQQITQASKTTLLPITNLGQVKHKQIISAYRASRALIYPSFSESLGLPLIEASQVGLDIIASECDYVRDVCSPCESFDPNSPTSIARAVKRYLGIEQPSLAMMKAQEFVDSLGV